MFRAISHRIALQFMGFVFLLLLINGIIFLAADVENTRRQMQIRLSRTTQLVMERTSITESGITVTLPPVTREQVRIVNLDGRISYEGGFFADIPFKPDTGISAMVLGNDNYSVLTTIMEKNGKAIGYMQIAEIARFQAGELRLRVILYIMVSTVISALTFGVGLFFARRSLRPAEQMVQRLEQFTQDASHELRTPIAALTSSLDLALKSKKYEEGILSAKDDVKQISTLVERLLELARADKLLLQSEIIDLSSLVQTVIDRHKAPAAEQKVELISSIEPGVTVKGDASLVQQILSNLLSNAVKFRKKDGGNVTVTLTKDMLSVTDTGIGIAPDVLPHIFDRFYQADTSRANGGYGLGLALVKRISELHGWTASAQSTEGKGATFRISLRSKTQDRS